MVERQLKLTFHVNPYIINLASSQTGLASAYLDCKQISALWLACTKKYPEGTLPYITALLGVFIQQAESESQDIVLI